MAGVAEDIQFEATLLQVDLGQLETVRAEVVARWLLVYWWSQVAEPVARCPQRREW